METDPQPRSLRHLLADIPLVSLLPEADTMVSGIAVDSRRVQPGEIFVALVGGTTDGHTYIPSAISRGAAAIIGSQSLSDLPVPYIRVADTRQTLPHLAAAYYDHPGRKLTVIGITGTDGKTTTANLIYQILRTAGMKTGMISTVSAVIGDEEIDTGFHVTTPDPVYIQRYLAKMVQRGLTHVVIEATSHGLAQYRVDGCEFDVAVVTNITHEHLDYHGSYEAYRQAKARLFLMLGQTFPKAFPTPRLGVLNRDDDSYEYLARLLPCAATSYGIHPQAEIRAVDVKQDQRGLSFTALTPAQPIVINSRLVGLYNVYNCLASVAVTWRALGCPVEAIQSGIAGFLGVSGRMERIEAGQDFTCIVDFAHTPNALQNVLQTVRSILPGRLIVVFGSAGLRDKEKRRLMAKVAMQFADCSIFTAEDPRTESLSEILDEMRSGAKAAGGVEGKTFFCIPDRGNAFRIAIKRANANDIVIVCGKGHEQSMCFGEVEYPWDDRTALRAALAEYLDLPGPQMPYLPTSDGKMGA